jgi:hypothetical protein
MKAPRQRRLFYYFTGNLTKMKFPVFFRILAVFNILGALLLLFALIVIGTAKGALVQVNPLVYAQLWLIALWLLATSFAWFFASGQSYGLLIINFISILALAGMIVILGWEKIQNRSGDGTMTIITALIPAIYSLFSLFGLFYKPIREWAKSISPNGLLKGNRSVAIAAVFSIGLFVAGGYGMQAYKPNQHEVVSCTVVFMQEEGASVYKGFYPYDIKPGENIDIPLTDSACFDAVRFTIVSGEYRPWTTARMVDDKGKEQQLSFSREGEYYIAKIKPTCSNSLTIYAPDSQDTTAYSIAAVHLIRHYSLFEEKPTDYVSVLPVMGDEEYIDAEGDYSESVINVDNVPAIIERGITILLREVDWNFEEVVNDEKGWTGPGGVKIGVFAHGLFGIRETAVQAFADYLDREYSESTISSMLGRQLFDESPEAGYDQASFRKVNPETITWIANNFIPSPSTELGIEGNPTLLKVYEENFQRLARLLVETRQHLYHNTDVNTEKTAYVDAMSEEEFHGPSWLSARYENLFVDQYGPEYTQGTFDAPLPPLLAGFWLRREMDGSSSAIWSALQGFMMQYDTGWHMKNTESWDEFEGD